MNETTGSPESQERARAFNVGQRETRAENHNNFDRSVGEKILGKGKATERSISEDEAVVMDGEIERLIDNGEAKDRSEAVNMLNQNEDNARNRGVFNPSPQNDGGESLRHSGSTGSFGVDGRRTTADEGEEEMSL